MTKKEFCEIMAAGHAQAEETLDRMSDRARENGRLGWASQLQQSAAEQDALARAFRDLAKEQE